MLIDTHAHLYSEEFNEDIDNIVHRAKHVGLNHILWPNIDCDSINPLNNLVATDNNFFKRMMGLHPCSVKEDYKEQLAVIKNELATNDCVAVGDVVEEIVQVCMPVLARCVLCTVNEYKLAISA